MQLLHASLCDKFASSDPHSFRCAYPEELEITEMGTDVLTRYLSQSQLRTYAATASGDKVAKFKGTKGSDVRIQTAAHYSKACHLTWSRANTLSL